MKQVRGQFRRARQSALDYHGQWSGTKFKLSIGNYKISAIGLCLISEMRW